MVNIDKIKKLAKDQGISITFVCNAVGQGPYYLNDVKRRGADIPDERLKIVADILHTTPEYLRDESEEKSPTLDTLTIILGLMKDRNLSQQELCRYLNLKKHAFSDWKSGKSQSYKKYLPQIADYLGVSVDYLLGRTDRPANANATPSAETAKDGFSRFSKEDSALVFALWGDTENIDEKDLEDVKRFAAFIKERKKDK